MIRFLGGVYFAALLIALMAGVVITATFIESSYDSHEVAVELVYKSPLFNILLAAFFLNIFLSTLRRYPFKKKHLPFIITHIGLLMVIGGTIIKNLWGIQGGMQIVEGSESNLLQLSGTKALHIDGTSYPIPGGKWQKFNTNDGMEVSLKSYLPHAKLHYTSLGYIIEECSELKEQPALSIECNKEKIALHFSDPYRWPLGDHIFSFKEHTIEIPHSVRLRQARKVCYPGTNNPSAYEADVWIDGKFFTLKMNEVYEAPSGYRFYLSSMSDAPQDSKQIAVVVNYDPARWAFTYPGACLVVLGSCLLFFKKKI